MDTCECGVVPVGPGRPSSLGLRPTIDGSHPFARTRLLLAFLTGTLGTSSVYREARLTSLDITDLQDVESMAVDGETVPAPDRIRLGKATAGLTVYRPEHPAIP